MGGNGGTKQNPGLSGKRVSSCAGCAGINNFIPENGGCGA